MATWLVPCGQKEGCYINKLQVQPFLQDVLVLVGIESLYIIIIILNYPPPTTPFVFANSNNTLILIIFYISGGGCPLLMDIFPDLPLSDSRYLFLNATSCYLNQSDSLD